ncbi:hypothetical protein RND81_09G159200 [Saponaria officinalis]|uniref:Secreted protein n=1 Tax=Saponaria officinalis TaxID=3572 RepID=A0AAW1IMF4_SAPOF
MHTIWYFCFGPLHAFLVLALRAVPQAMSRATVRAMARAACRARANFLIFFIFKRPCPNFCISCSCRAGRNYSPCPCRVRAVSGGRTCPPTLFMPKFHSMYNLQKSHSDYTHVSITKVIEPIVIKVTIWNTHTHNMEYKQYENIYIIKSQQKLKNLARTKITYSNTKATKTNTKITKFNCK